MKRLLAITLLLLWAAAAWAGPYVVSVPLLSSPPAVDGDLSDEAWKQASVVRGFVPARLAEAEIASPLTIMRLAHTQEAVYLAFECREPRLEHLVAGQPERDYAMNLADSLSLYFDLGQRWEDDTYIEIGHDCTTVYHDSYARDHAWDGAWTCAAGRTATAWTLEFCIPFADIRATLQPGDIWWLSVERNRLAGGKGEAQSWCPAPGAVRSHQAAGRLVFGQYADNAWAAAQALAARIDQDLALLRDEAAKTEEGSKALDQIEALRAQAQAWAALPADASLTADQWGARRGEVDGAAERFRQLYWEVRFAALLDG